MKRTLKTSNLAAALAIIAAMGFALLRAQSEGFQFHGPISRVITPNGDGLNDLAIFCFGNPADSGVTGKIYSFSGVQIAAMVQQTPALQGCPQSGLNPQSMTWDGRMNGRVVTSGIYLYEISAEGRSYTGTILVAR
jgi:hypothetical protein